MSPAAASESGEFAPLRLPATVVRVVREVPSGRLQVVQSGVRRTLAFAAGRIRAVSSSLESERLGSWLVARGFVLRSVVTDLLLRKSRDERLGDLLIRKGTITGERLGEELVALALAVCARMLLEGGKLTCEPAAVTGATVLDHDPTSLFMLAARRSSDAARLEALLAGQTRWVGRPAAAGPEEPELTGVERFLLSRLTAARSLDELRREMPQQPQDVTRSLAALIVAGLVMSSGPVAATRLAAPRAGAPAGDRAAADEALPAANSRLRAKLAAVDPEGAAARLEAAGAAAAPTPAALAQAEVDKKAAAELFRDGGDRRAGYRLLSRAVEIAPDAQSLVLLAELEMANPLWRQKALDHFKLALDLDPRLTAAWVGLGNYWSLRGEPQKQQRCLEKVLAYEPRNEEVRRTLELLSGRTS